MEVYLEYVVIDNLVVDYLLLSLTRKTLKLPPSRFLTVLSAIIGTIAAVIMPTLKMSAGFTYVFKILLGALLVLVSGTFKTPKEYIRSYYLFLLYTFLFGGTVWAAFNFLNVDYNALSFTYDAEFPLGLILVTALVVYYSAYAFIRYLYRKREATPYLRKCVIELNGTKLKTMGFIDTGNRMYCKRTGCPIIICSPKIGKRLKEEGALTNEKSEIMSYYTAAGRSYFKIYKLDGLQIYNGDKPNRIYNVKMGVSREDFRSDGEYEIILNPSMV